MTFRRRLAEEPASETKLGNEHGKHEPIGDLSLISSGQKEEAAVCEVSNARQEEEPSQKFGAVATTTTSQQWRIHNEHSTSSQMLYVLTRRRSGQ